VFLQIGKPLLVKTLWHEGAIYIFILPIEHAEDSVSLPSTFEPRLRGIHMRRSPRQPEIISDQLNRRLHLYVTAASASGVGLLALAQPANAEVVYTRAHVVIAPNSTYLLDLNHDGITDLIIKQHSYPGYSATLYVAPGAGAIAARAGVGSCECEASAFALKAGAVVSSGDPFFVGAEFAKVKKIESSIRSFGLWRNETNRYLAVKFTINGDVEAHYGWARFSVQASYEGGVTATLTGYAYETIEGQSIKAGQIAGGADAPIYERGSLGSLAAGAMK
jgi:hypothetical protein